MFIIAMGNGVKEEKNTSAAIDVREKFRHFRQAARRTRDKKNLTSIEGASCQDGLYWPQHWCCCHIRSYSVIGSKYEPSDLGLWYFPSGEKFFPHLAATAGVAAADRPTFLLLDLAFARVLDLPTECPSLGFYRPFPIDHGSIAADSRSKRLQQSCMTIDSQIGFLNRTNTEDKAPSRVPFFYLSSHQIAS